MVFTFIWKCIKVYLVIFLSYFLLTVVLAIPMGLFSVVFNMDPSHIDTDAYHIYSLPALALVFHCMAILWSSHYRTSEHAIWLISSSFITVFFLFVGTLYGDLFFEGVAAGTVQNVLLVSITHVVPFFVIFEDEDDATDEELTFKEDDEDENNNGSEYFNDTRDWGEEYKRYKEEKSRMD